MRGDSREAFQGRKVRARMSPRPDAHLLLEALRLAWGPRDMKSNVTRSSESPAFLASSSSLPPSHLAFYPVPPSPAPRPQPPVPLPASSAVSCSKGKRRQYWDSVPLHNPSVRPFSCEGSSSGSEMLHTAPLCVTFTES